jgi:hypothetical protein
MAVTKPKRPTTKPKKRKIAHYGACPPGQIRDHNKSSPTYGKCISVLAKKKRKPKSDGFTYG